MIGLRRKRRQRTPSVAAGRAPNQNGYGHDGTSRNGAGSAGKAVCTPYPYRFVGSRASFDMTGPSTPSIDLILHLVQQEALSPVQYRAASARWRIQTTRRAVDTGTHGEWR